MAGPLVNAKLEKGNDWSDELEILDFDFNIAIWGTFTATVTVQVKPMWRDVSADWIDLQECTEPVLDTSWPIKGLNRIRVGIKSGDYSSGIANVSLYRGEDDSRRAIVSKKFVQ